MNAIRRFLILTSLAATVVLAVPGAGSSRVMDLRHRLSRMYVASMPMGGIVGFAPGSYLGGNQTKIKIPFGVVVDKRAREVIVANLAAYHGRSRGSLVVLPAGQGNVAPKAVISCRGFSFWAVTLDASGNIVSGNLKNSSILTFARNAQGCAQPIAYLGGPSTGMQTPLGVAYNSLGQLVVLNFNAGIEIFAPGASGDVAPIAKVYGAQTGLVATEALALDRQNNMYAASYANGEILEFAAGSNGNVSPMRTIAGPHTMLKNPIGLAIDRRGSIYVADYGAEAVLVFAPDAQGDATPANVIRVPEPTAIALPR